MKNMKTLFWILFFFSCTLLTGLKEFTASRQPVFQIDLDLIQNQLRNRIEAVNTQQEIAIGGDLIYSNIVLPIFYESRFYRPAWISESGLISSIDSLLDVIRGAHKEGFKPQDYHLQIINDKISEFNSGKEIDKIGTLADIDILLTDAFLVLGAHYIGGRIDPETIDPDWSALRREADLAVLLHDALSINRVKHTLQMLLPQHSAYTQLRDALARYRKISEADYQEIHLEQVVKAGDQSEIIPLLRTKLFVLGDLQENNPHSDYFDKTLESSLMRFQQRHGLVADGQLNPATILALNVPLAELLSRIKVNMERWRWLPEQLGLQHIIVNIANFELDVVDNAVNTLTMKVVVGKLYRKTPVFSDRMAFMVINPFWEVPKNLAVQDIIPKIKNDPKYLTNMNMRILDGWGAKAREVPADSIDWNFVSSRNFTYRLRQGPGPLNALGKIKFMFPNKYNVYLHDTAAKGLFNEQVRVFSSGCIRIEKPQELAEWLLKNDPAWTKESINRWFESETEKTISIKSNIPVHIVYLTSWGSETGYLNFRDDIYGRDKLLADALSEQVPNK